MPDKIHLTVATVIERDNKFLLVKELSSSEEVYNQPAGHVEPGETLAAAALRETLEETGWHVSLEAVLGISHYTAPSNGVTYYRVGFVARPLHREQSPILDDDILDALWLTYDEILSLKDQLRSPLVLNAIEKYRAGITYPLAMIDEHS